MNILRSFIRKTLEKMGYSIHRINYIAPQKSSNDKRTIVNAYYKGHQFKCFMGDYLSECILTGKGWDNELESILDGLALNGKHGDVIEIGANIGASMVPIANKYPNLTFHCVEPVPEFFNLLQDNILSYRVDNVKSYNQAIASVDGKTVNIHTQLGTAGALADYDNHVYMGTLSSAAKTIDTFFNGKNVVFVKLDVDGFEFEILKGGVKTFDRCHPVCFLEFHTKIMRRLGIDPNEILNYFKDLGYDRISIYNNFVHIKTTDSYGELLDIADSATYYVDALFEKTKN